MRPLRDTAAWSDRMNGNKIAVMDSGRELPSRIVSAMRTTMATASVTLAIATMIAIVFLGTPGSAIAQNFTVDTTASDALTNYLRQNRLPLVGAQIGSSTTGERRLVLYGYVATQMGKDDAQAKAVAHLGGPPPEVINRIVIQPELATMKSGGQGDNQTIDQGGSPGDASTGSVNDYSNSGGPAGAFPGQSFDKVADDIQRYGIKSMPDE
jgi:hypothetical protein